MNWRAFVRDHPGTIRTHTPLKGKALLEDVLVRALVGEQS